MTDARGKQRRFSRRRLEALRDYALYCSVSALVGHAGRWHHFADGEVIVAAELLL